MNPETIDSEYTKLQQEGDQVSQAIADFSQKLQSASAGGDPNARDYLLDLKSIALQIQQEQLQMRSLLQAVHDFTVTHLSDPNAQQMAPQYAPQGYQPQYAPQPGYGYQQARPGGLLGRFLGGGFGQAVAAGVGFGIGDDLINDIL